MPAFPTQQICGVLAIALFALTACGAIQPGTPGKEPATAGRYNPVAQETNSGGR